MKVLVTVCAGSVLGTSLVSVTRSVRRAVTTAVLCTCAVLVRTTVRVVEVRRVTVVRLVPAWCRVRTEVLSRVTVTGRGRVTVSVM